MSVFARGSPPTNLFAVISVLRELLQPKLAPSRIIRLVLSVERHLPEILAYATVPIPESLLPVLKAANESEWTEIVQRRMNPVLQTLQSLETEILHGISDLVSIVLIAWEGLRQKSETGKYFVDETMMNCHIQIAQFVNKIDNMSTGGCTEYLKQMSVFFAEKAAETADHLLVEGVTNEYIKDYTTRGEWSKKHGATLPNVEKMSSHFQWLKNAILCTSSKGSRIWFDSFKFEAGVLYAKWYGTAIREAQCSVDLLGTDPLLHKGDMLKTLETLKSIDLVEYPDMEEKRAKVVQTAETFISQLNTSTVPASFDQITVGAKIMTDVLNGKSIDYAQVASLCEKTIGYDVLSLTVFKQVIESVIDNELLTILMHIVNQQTAIFNLINAGGNGTADNDTDEEIIELEPKQFTVSNPFSDNTLQEIIEYDMKLLPNVKKERTAEEALDETIIATGNFAAIQDRLNKVQNTLKDRVRSWKENENYIKDAFQSGKMQALDYVTRTPKTEENQTLHQISEYVVASPVFIDNQVRQKSLQLWIESDIPWLRNRAIRLISACNSIIEAQKKRTLDRANALARNRNILFYSLLLITGLAMLTIFIFDSNHVDALLWYLQTKWIMLKMAVPPKIVDTFASVTDSVSTVISHYFSPNIVTEKAVSAVKEICFRNESIGFALDSLQFSPIGSTNSPTLFYDATKNVVETTTFGALSDAFMGAVDFVAGTIASGASVASEKLEVVKDVTTEFIQQGIEISTIPLYEERYLNFFQSTTVKKLHLITYILEDAANVTILTYNSLLLLYGIFDQKLFRKLMPESEITPIRSILTKWLLGIPKSAAALIACFLIGASSRVFIQTVINIGTVSFALNNATIATILGASISASPKILTRTEKWISRLRGHPEPVEIPPAVSREELEQITVDKAKNFVGLTRFGISDTEPLLQLLGNVNDRKSTLLSSRKIEFKLPPDSLLLEDARLLSDDQKRQFVNFFSNADNKEPAEKLLENTSSTNNSSTEIDGEDALTEAQQKRRKIMARKKMEAEAKAKGIEIA